MSGVSPAGVAENGTRTGKESFDCLCMCVVFPNLLSCLPSLVSVLVTDGQHYYEGSDSSAERVKGLHAAEVSLIIACEFPNIPSQTTLLPFHSPRFNTLPVLVHRASRLTDLRGLPPPGVGPRLGRVVRSEVHALLGRSPTGLAKSSLLSLRTVLSSPVAPHPFA